MSAPAAATPYFDQHHFDSLANPIEKTVYVATMQSAALDRKHVLVNELKQCTASMQNATAARARLAKTKRKTKQPTPPTNCRNAPLSAVSKQAIQHADTLGQLFAAIDLVQKEHPAAYAAGDRARGARLHGPRQQVAAGF